MNRRFLSLGETNKPGQERNQTAVAVQPAREATEHQSPDRKASCAGQWTTFQHRGLWFTSPQWAFPKLSNHPPPCPKFNEMENFESTTFYQSCDLLQWSASIFLGHATLLNYWTDSRLNNELRLLKVLLNAMQSWIHSVESLGPTRQYRQLARHQNPELQWHWADDFSQQIEHQAAFLPMSLCAKIGQKLGRQSFSASSSSIRPHCSGTFIFTWGQSPVTESVTWTLVYSVHTV